MHVASSSRHHEIRLSLTKLLGVNKAPLKPLARFSVRHAALVRRSSLLLTGGSASRRGFIAKPVIVVAELSQTKKIAPPSRCPTNTTFAVDCVHLPDTHPISQHGENKYTILPDAFSPGFVPCHRCGCGELCRFVQMGDAVEAFRQVTFTDPQSPDSAHHQRVV